MTVRQDGGYVQCHGPAGRVTLGMDHACLQPSSGSTDNVLQLAMATLTATFAGSYLALRGDGSAKKTTPPTNSTSKDEEAFIQYYRQLRGMSISLTPLKGIY